MSVITWMEHYMLIRWYQKLSEIGKTWICLLPMGAPNSAPDLKSGGDLIQNKFHVHNISEKLTFVDLSKFSQIFSIILLQSAILSDQFIKYKFH